MTGRIPHARNDGFHRADPASAGRDLVVVDEQVTTQELLRRFLSTLGPDAGVLLADGTIEAAWVMEFVPANRGVAREHYYRLAKEFGILNWERLPWQARVLTITTTWSGIHPPVSTTEGEY